MGDIQAQVRITYLHISAVKHCPCLTEDSAVEAKVSKSILIPGLQKLFDKQEEQDEKKPSRKCTERPEQQQTGYLMLLQLSMNQYLWALLQSLLLSSNRRSLERPRFIGKTRCSGARPLRKCDFTLCHECQKDAPR